MNGALVPDACGHASATRPGRHILVVDDDESTRVIVSTILEDAGFAVESAGAPEEALQAVPRSAPAGCQPSLTKPVYPDDLVASVEKVLAAARS